MVFSIDDASSTKCLFEIGNESEFHYLGISCFLCFLLHKLLQFLLALLFPLFRKASIDMRQILVQTVLSVAKPNAAIFCGCLCFSGSASCINCRTQGTHWWRHCFREASGVVWCVYLLARWRFVAASKFQKSSLPSGLLQYLKPELEASCHSLSPSLMSQSTWFSEQPSSLSTRAAKTMFYDFIHGINFWVRLADRMSYCHAYFGDVICRSSNSLCVTEPQEGHTGTGRRRVEHHFVLIQLEGTWTASLLFFLFFQTLNG